jgi:hypothetical protein
MARTLLEYTFFAGRPGARVDDKISVYDDGSLWYWSLAAAPSGSANRVGTFTTSLSAENRSDAKVIADSLIGLTANPVEEYSGAIQVTVTAHSGEKSVAHSYALKDDAPLSATLKRAQQFGFDRIKQAEDHPLAVARLTLRPQQDHIAPGASTAALFIIESLGNQPVLFQFLPQTFSVMGESQHGTAFSWAGRAKETMGLVDSDANLVDGVNVAARMPPQMKATAAFMNALQAGEAGTYQLRGRVEGVIVLHFPDAEPDAYPRTAFWLTSNPVPFKVG